MYTANIAAAEVGQFITWLNTEDEDGSLINGWVEVESAIVIEAEVAKFSGKFVDAELSIEFIVPVSQQITVAVLD